MAEIVPVVPDSSGESGNTKQIPPAKMWCFTWNNPPENGYKDLIKKFKSHRSNKFIFQYEMGESGTPHYQGFVIFNTKVRAIQHVGIPQIHWEKKSPKSTILHNVNYCSKEPRLDGPWIEGFKIPRKRRELNFVWKPWQLEIMEISKTVPDDRSVYWYWSENGGVGKSVIAEWLLTNYDAVVCSGKAADMKYLIAEYEDNKGFYPDVVIFDVPRSSCNYISYTGIEEIKNGVFCSQKYKSKCCIMPHAHVFVFANEAPDETQLSVDRLKVFEIK